MTVRVLLKGRFGPRWLDVDQTVTLPAGATLHDAVNALQRRGIDVEGALRDSPHLRHSMMWNGERAPLSERGDEVMADGDVLSLLGPLGGG